MITYDEPRVLALIVRNRPRPLLIGLDVDGVLAPIAGHADDAALLAGMGDSIGTVARLGGVHVAVISGRSLADLQRFGFGADVEVIGSHGMEIRGAAMAPLSTDERSMLAALDAAAVAAAAVGGEGAWVERKPASVVLHVRQAKAGRGSAALGALADAVGAMDGPSTKAGSGVLEAFVRHADKGAALVELGTRIGAASIVFVGDDITDEEAFARLGPDDVAIKVGVADTIARYRLRDPGAVLAWLDALAA